MQWIRKRLKSATDHGTEPCQKRQVLILGMGAIKLKSFSEKCNYKSSQCVCTWDYNAIEDPQEERSTLTQKHSLPWVAIYIYCTRRAPAESMLHVRLKGTFHFQPLALLL